MDAPAIRPPRSVATIPPPPVTTPSPPPPPPTRTQPSRWSFFTEQILVRSRKFFLRECPWLQRYSPRWFQPDFTWPHRVLATGQLSQEMPEIQPLTSTYWRPWIGQFHLLLCWLSEFYCAWYGHRYSSAIVPLPFGLILKWADGTSFDEARSMMAIRDAGFPCPKVISVGEHPRPSIWSPPPVSILMTRIPGDTLDEVYDSLGPTERSMIFAEISTMLETMRAWTNPWGQRICSISGGPIRSIRVPNHRVEPCESEKEFHSYLLSAASPHSFQTSEEFNTALELAKKLDDNHHRIVFTHGDLATHNIMVDGGHVSGFIDWECAGWYPEYWEFTTPLRWPGRDPEGGGFFKRLGGRHYEKELKSEMALVALTVDSWISF